MREKAEGFRFGSPRCDHLNGYRRKMRVEKIVVRRLVAKDLQDKVIEVIDGDKRTLIG